MHVILLKAQNKPNNSKLFRVQKIKNPPYWVAMYHEMQKYLDHNPTKTTPSLRLGDETSHKTVGTDLPSCDWTDGKRINKSTGKQVLGSRHNTIRLADSASEFDGGDGIQSTIKDKTSHSVGAECLENTKAPSFSNEPPAHSTGIHDSANSSLLGDSCNETCPSSGDHSTQSETEEATCPSVKNYAATQQEKLLHSVSVDNASAKSKDYLNDSTDSVEFFVRGSIDTQNHLFP